MSGAKAPAFAALYLDVVDIVKQQGKRSCGLVHHLQTDQEPPSVLILPQRI